VAGCRRSRSQASGTASPQFSGTHGQWRVTGSPSNSAERGTRWLAWIAEPDAGVPMPSGSGTYSENMVNERILSKRLAARSSKLIRKQP
jgi:hypothetical protein